MQYKKHAFFLFYCFNVVSQRDESIAASHPTSIWASTMATPPNPLSNAVFTYFSINSLWLLPNAFLSLKLRPKSLTLLFGHHSLISTNGRKQHCRWEQSYLPSCFRVKSSILFLWSMRSDGCRTWPMLIAPDIVWPPILRGILILYKRLMLEMNLFSPARSTQVCSFHTLSP